MPGQLLLKLISRGNRKRRRLHVEEDQRTRQVPGKKKKRPNIEELDVKAPKKEKTPRKIKLEVASIDTTPKDVPQNDVAKTKAEMESD